MTYDGKSRAGGLHKLSTGRTPTAARGGRSSFGCCCIIPCACLGVLVLRCLVAAHLRLLSRCHGLGVLLLSLGEIVEPGVL